MPPQEEIWSQARRNAQIWIAWGVKRDWTATAILDALREHNMGYRMTNFFADVRRIKGIGIQSHYVKALDPSSSVPRSWMIETSSEIWKIPEKHKAVYDVTIRDPETGETTEHRYDVGFEREISKGEAESYVENVLPWEAYEPEKEIVGVDLIGWKHKAGESY